MRIPLFDIDWTLLKGGNKTHVDAFTHTFRTVYGIDGSIDQIEHHGMTDRQAIIAVLEHHGWSREEAMTQMEEARFAMIDYFSAHREEGEYVTMPGAEPLLMRLAEMPCGLLTGNTEQIAWYKLEAARILRFFKFGAFGDATDRRVDLIAEARRRFLSAHRRYRGPLTMVIIGDSPRDVQCAKAGGILSVAVASGKYSRELLAQENPDLLLNSLEESDALCEFLWS